MTQESHHALPSFLCIGTQKAGTSWLFEQIRQHPNVWLPPIKELHYFDHVYCLDNREWTQWHIKKNAKSIIEHHIKRQHVDFDYIRYIASIASGVLFSERWYRAIFERPAALEMKTGDITPEYCAIGNDGIRYLRELLGEPKLIWFVRDPLQRALSQLRMNASRHLQTNTPTKQQWSDLSRDPVIFDRGNLSEYIPQWEAQFLAESILYIPFKEISKHPTAVLRKVEDHIGIPPFSGYSAPEKIIHKTPLMNIPESVIKDLHAALTPQYDFLEKRFGKEFCDLT